MTHRNKEPFPWVPFLWLMLGIGIVLWLIAPILASIGNAGSIETITIAGHPFTAELAISQAEQERGLMFRTSLPSDRAMLFVFDPPQEVQFWMKNTLIPLDMIFVRADGIIAGIKQDAKPESLDIIPSPEPVADVIEVAGGTARALGVHVGDYVAVPIH